WAFGCACRKVCGMVVYTTTDDPAVTQSKQWGVVGIRSRIGGNFVGALGISRRSSLWSLIGHCPAVLARGRWRRSWRSRGRSRECKHGFGIDERRLFSGRGGCPGASPRTSDGSDGGTFSTTGNSADNRPKDSASAELGCVALGVGFALDQQLLNMNVFRH